MDDGSKPSVTISEDGKELVYRSADGDIKWCKGPPTMAEWRRFKEGAPDLAQGRFNFAWVSDMVVEAWFQPKGWLDFTVHYDIGQGELLSIADAR
jgi:hypothetical protein